MNGKYHCMKREADNFFTLTGLGKMDVPLRVRLTSITNEQIETTISEIKNGVSLPSDKQFSAFDAGSKCTMQYRHVVVLFSHQESVFIRPTYVRQAETH